VGQFLASSLIRFQIINKSFERFYSAVILCTSKRVTINIKYARWHRGKTDKTFVLGQPIIADGFLEYSYV